ncbi:hypothetical protein N476_09410 [Pseudoalteromonas luteoviolacea H33]|uniref:Uncharacterized protein n=1 Tax=Pseudoalteromonas luteoviolacea H33 TaxID=1365251 RepID=A0A167FU90_9GAMM|nr:hypothetical protein N476_09410 [Pseudoalteromonas luteoviolacea H33]KZN78091.1 hypothetical protein N477_10655 [Pseudoalteromonas luteoviolacea H33-S]
MAILFNQTAEQMLIHAHENYVLYDTSYLGTFASHMTSFIYFALRAGNECYLSLSI